jgi:uncharacterized membrane protein
VHPFFSLGFSCFVFTLLFCSRLKSKARKKRKKKVWIFDLLIFLFLMNFTKLWLGYCSQLIQPELFLVASKRSREQAVWTN